MEFIQCFDILSQRQNPINSCGSEYIEIEEILQTMSLQQFLNHVGIRDEVPSDSKTMDAVLLEEEKKKTERLEAEIIYLKANTVSKAEYDALKANTVSKAEYDALKERLDRLEKNHN